MSKLLLSPTQLGPYELANHMVMAPMTRNRAEGNIPNKLMATYYGQRAGAGLIITEGTSPSPNGLGYPRIPGIFSQEQINGWKSVTDTVHKKGGKIFLQIMHTGRVSHPLNMPEGTTVLAPSAVPLPGEMYTDQEGPKPHPTAKMMTDEEITSTIAEYVEAAENAIKAGFDGIELHGANGYLIEQFIHPHTNRREDKWGGNIEKRMRFAIEIAQQTVRAIGKEKVGIRLSPYGTFNDMPIYDEIHDAYIYLAKELDKLGLLYIHLVDHSGGGAPEVPDAIKQGIHEVFSNTLILSGGYDKERAEADLEGGKGELIAFARKFLANPDLVERFQKDAPLNEPDYDTFYTPGEKGYTDYPTLESTPVKS